MPTWLGLPRVAALAGGSTTPDRQLQGEHKRQGSPRESDETSGNQLNWVRYMFSGKSTKKSASDVGISAFVVLQRSEFDSTILFRYNTMLSALE